MPTRLYLDNAATSWPKPESVYQAVNDYQRNVGAAAGRGAYGSAQTSSRLLTNLRAAIRRLFDASADHDVVFTQNCTDSLNLAIGGLLKEGDHVVTSVAEHNSVLRPLAHLSRTRNIDVTYVSYESDGKLLPQTLAGEIRDSTRLVALTHASNVTGTIQSLSDVVTVAKEKGVLTLIDAAQTAGQVPISLSQTPVDLLAMSGHKGLCGPLGTGVLCIAPGLAEQLTPLRFGGTGVNSESMLPPSDGPERFEVGNLNMVGLAGLAAGVAHLLESPPTQSITHLNQLAIESMISIDGVNIAGPLLPAERVGLVSFDVDGFDCHEIASMLDSAFQIEVRAGMHCAPQIHNALSLPGTVRASWGSFTTESDLLRLAEALQEIAAARPA